MPTDAETADREALAAIVTTFFDAFTSGPGTAERLDALRVLFVPSAVVVRTCGGPPEVYDVDGFLAPRELLLTSGELTGFREWPLDGRTDVWGDIAQHWCTYAKSGARDGVRLTGRGTKSMQLVRTPAGWRITAVAWDDERDGLTLLEE